MKVCTLYIKAIKYYNVNCWERKDDGIYVSLREKKMGKAVPMRATAMAPATRYAVPSDETSPIAATTIEEDLLFLFL